MAHAPPTTAPQLTLALPAEPAREPDPTHVLSFGLGLDSSAVLVRWSDLPETRPCPLSELLVISAMTGDEWEITGQLVREHILPRLREHNVRFVQVARQGPVQSDGIAVLSDTRSPSELYLDGAYRLSEELTESGTVPQVGGARKCSAKAKGWPIDRFLALAARSPFRQAVGFALGEEGRARRDATYDTARRRGFYPLIEWGWDRERSARFLREHTGVEAWPKSACTYCPFALTSRTGRERTLRQFDEHPDVAVRALILEHRAVCLNPTQGLIAGSRLKDLFEQTGRHTITARFRAELESTLHTLYEVRRIRRPRPGDPTRQSNACRHLRLLAQGSRAAMLARLEASGRLDRSDPAATRVWLRRRSELLPSAEHYLVAGPAGALEKGDERFEQWWAALTGESAFAAQLLAA